MKTFEKITGDQAGESLNRLLGRKNKILGTSDKEVYAKKLTAMDIDSLFSHGMKEYGIKPGVNQVRNRASFEKKCIAAFREKTKLPVDHSPQFPKPPKRKKDREALAKALRQGI